MGGKRSALIVGDHSPYKEWKKARARQPTHPLTHLPTHPRPLYEYVASGADDEQTLWENRQGFHRLLLCPRVARDVSRIDTSLSLFNGSQHASMPVFLSPAGT